MLSKLKTGLSGAATALGLGRGASTVTLFVVEGPNAGTAQKLAAATYRLGSGLDCDIVLADAALAPVHTLIEVDRRRVRVEPLAGAVMVPGRDGAVEPGDALTLPLPAELILGGTRLVLRAPVEIGGGVTRFQALAAAALLMAVLGGLSGIAFSSGEPAVEPAMPAAARPEKPVVQTAALAPVVPHQETPEAALRARIDQAHIDGIALTASGNRIVAAGRLSAEEMARWRDIQAWFDRTFAGSSLLSSEVGAGPVSEAPEVVIQAVWTGANPYLITHTGSKYFEGADLGGGWSVETIRPDAVTLRSRSGQTFVMSLTDPAKP